MKSTNTILLKVKMDIENILYGQYTSQQTQDDVEKIMEIVTKAFELQERANNEFVTSLQLPQRIDLWELTNPTGEGYGGSPDMPPKGMVGALAEARGWNACLDKINLLLV